MAASTRSIETLLDEVRLAQANLAALTDSLHAEAGVTGAMRGVLDGLSDPDRDWTVPRLAEEKSVSRQHIQTLTNALLAKGLVRTQPNPNNRRSPFVALTERGQALVEQMRADEQRVLGRMARELDPSSLALAAGQISDLNRWLTDYLGEARPR